MFNMLRSQFQKLCLNSDKYGVNSRKYRLAMLTVFSMLAVFAMLAISWFIEIGIRSSLLHSCVLQTFFCSRFTELQKYTSASRKRVTHSRARHKGALRPRDKECEQIILRLRVAFMLLKIISFNNFKFARS